MSPDPSPEPGVDPYAATQAQFTAEAPGEAALPEVPVLARIKVAKGWADVELVSLGVQGVEVRIPAAPPTTRTVLLAVKAQKAGAPVVKMLEEIIGKRRERSHTLLRLRHKQFLCPSGGRQAMGEFLREVVGFEIVPRAAMRTGAEGVYFDYDKAMRPVTTPHGRKLRGAAAPLPRG